MSTGSINNWQSGASPNGDTLLKFADYFGVTTDYLLTGKENTYKEENKDMGDRFINFFILKDGLKAYFDAVISGKPSELSDDEIYQKIANFSGVCLQRLNQFIELAYSLDNSTPNKELYYPRYSEFLKLLRTFPIDTNVQEVDKLAHALRSEHEILLIEIEEEKYLSPSEKEDGESIKEPK